MLTRYYLSYMRLGRPPNIERCPRILSLDGGGVRGLSSLLILRNMMEEIARRNGTAEALPCQYFDLIGGTGTGGLIAIMLGWLGMVDSHVFCANCGSRSMKVSTNISTYQGRFSRSIRFERESSPPATINVVSTIESSKTQSKIWSKGNCRMPTLSWPIHTPRRSRRSLLRQKVFTLMDHLRYSVRINAQVIMQTSVQSGKPHGLRARCHYSSSPSRSRLRHRGVLMWTVDWLITILGRLRCQKGKGFGVR